MTARCLFVACIAPLLFAGGLNAGSYQLTNDGRTYVWNNYPRSGDTASWSGQTDSRGYATGYGTLTWYKHGAWASRYSGTMMSGKLNGAVTNEDADGKKFRGTYVNGGKSNDWAEVSDIAETLSPAVSAREAETVELVAGQSAGYIDYGWAGMGNSGIMVVRVVNKTEREWRVEIEVGTKLEPSDGDAQSMVVTKEINVHLEPHESHDIEVEVACLDISKPPPAETNTSWTATVSPRLAQFMACANKLANQFLQRMAADAEADKAQAILSKRPMLLQFALWQARGATRDQWIDFFVHYQRMDPGTAREVADAFAQLSGAVVQRCPSI
jgi:hypothetical protein